MTTYTNSQSLSQGRPVTALFVYGAGIGGMVFNIYAAHHIYDGVAAWILAFIMFCIEGLAILALRHIITDYENNNYMKSAAGAIAFAGIVVICVFMGYRALNSLNIDLQETNKYQIEKAERMEVVAGEYFAAAKTLTGSSKSTQLGYGERQLTKAQNIRIEVKKSQPLPFAMILLILLTVEVVKMVGRYAFATESKEKWNWTRRRTEKLKQRARLADARAAAEQAESNVHALPVRG